MTKESRLEQHIKTIARWIIECEHIVAFTGAGISTESGIPDFRGPQGVWTRRDAGLPAPRWRVPPHQVEPNASHLSLLELQRLGKLQFLVTQNTDNLHRRSGIHPELLAELQDRKSTRLNSSHANISYAVFCLKKKKLNFIP